MFTKILRTFVKRWRSFGIRCVIYIDDGILGKLLEHILNNEIKIITVDLEKAGFSLNWTKSQMYPLQRGKWLGFII